MLLEDLRHRHPLPRLQLGVEIEERHTKHVGDEAPDRGLPCPRETNEHDVSHGT